MASRTVILALALMLASCGTCDAPPPSDPDTGSMVDAGDGGDVDGGGVDAASDVAPDDTSPVSTRTMLQVPPLNGLPTANRIASPEFQPVHFLQVGTETGARLVRQVYRETPYESAVARLIGEGRPVDLLLWGQAGEGEHSASVWIGTDGDTLPDAVTVELHGITLGDLEGPVAPVPLRATEDTIVEDDRAWVRYGGTFPAVTGPFQLRIAADGSRDILVHAPIVLGE